jgi:hypothetical protein
MIRHNLNEYNLSNSFGKTLARHKSRFLGVPTSRVLMIIIIIFKNNFFHKKIICKKLKKNVWDVKKCLFLDVCEFFDWTKL